MTTPILAEPELRVEVAFTVGASTSTLLHLDDPSRGLLDTGTLAEGDDVESPVWTDITEWFRSGTINRGSRRIDTPIVQYDPGTCSIVLGNEDRRFDPSNLAGPYTQESSDLDGTEVVLNTNSGFETAGPANWAGFGGTLTRVSDRVHTGSWAGKFVPSGVFDGPIVASDWQTFTPGQTYRAAASVQCDETHTVFVEIHWYTAAAAFISASSSMPVYLSADTWTEIQVTAVAPAGAVMGPMVIYMSGTPAASKVLWVDEATISHLPYRRVTQVTAMRAVRVLATWASTTYELFRGFADNWDGRWFDPGDAEVVLTATDGMKVLVGNDRTGGGSSGVGELTGARINRILDSVGWPAADRLISTGTATVQGTDLDGDALSELRLVSDSEIGELYLDGGGRVVFRGRNDMLTESRSAMSQATFGDLVGELSYADLSSTADDATFYNQIRVTRAGGTEQVAEDTTSQALLYTKTFRPTTEPILETDAAALAYAQWLLHISREPEFRFTGMDVKPLTDGTNLFPQALGRQIGDRLTAIRRPPGGGDPIERDCFIRGIEQVISQGNWLTRWSFSSAEKFGSFFVLDSATLGRLDYNALGY